MFTKINDTIPYYHFSVFENGTHAGESRLPYAVFTRHGGKNEYRGASEEPFDSLNVRYGIGDPDKDVLHNRTMMQKFFEEKFLNGRKTLLVSGNQTHSDHIFSLDEKDEEKYEKLMERAGMGTGTARCAHTEIDDTDAFITNRRDVVFMTQVADCQPIILFDPGTLGADTGEQILGVVHSGWRGSVANILGKTIARMRDEFGADPSRILVGVGPSIGPCCHYFTDPKSELPEEFHRYILRESGDVALAGHRVDFLAATRDQLLHEGIRETNIEFSGICTCDSTDEFYSYRRSGVRPTGRFAIMAGLK